MMHVKQSRVLLLLGILCMMHCQAVKSAPPARNTMYDARQAVKSAPPARNTMCDALSSSQECSSC